MRKRPLAWLAPCLLGLTGSLAVAVAAPRLAGGGVRWWFDPALPGASTVLYGGMAALVIAWAWLGAAVWRGEAGPRQLGLIAGAWALPLLITAPVFSRDVYSYLAQGTLAHLGHSPYTVTPAALVHLGHPATLAAVSPFWRHTTAPYGPAFLGLTGVIAGLAGSNLVLGATLVKLLAGAGLALLCLWVPRLAGRLGADPGRAAWLVVVNPLVLLALVAPGHNDLLMVGLLAMGVALAVDHRHLLGIAVCAAAATIKLPALAGALFIAVVWARTLPAGWARQRSAALALAVTGGVLVALSFLSGLGLGWISPSVLSTPARVHLAITPSTAVGWTLASLLHAGGIHVRSHAVESGVGVLTLVLAGAFALTQLRRIRSHDLPWRLGLALGAFALAGPAAWPWYLVWGLTLLAVGARGGTWPALAIASVLGAFVVRPDGILALPIQSAPLVVCFYAACAAAAVWIWRRAVGGGRARTRYGGVAVSQDLAGIR